VGVAVIEMREFLHICCSAPPWAQRRHNATVTPPCSFCANNQGRPKRLPTVEVVPARPFTSAERHTREPTDQQNCGHNPKEVGGEADSCKKAAQVEVPANNRVVSSF